MRSPASGLSGSFDPQPLEEARRAVLRDVELMGSDSPVPDELQPLDAGFIEWPGKLVQEHAQDPHGSLVGRIQAAADRFRKQLDRVVFLGIGGSYMGARALFEALGHPHHNELDAARRNGTPRVSFAGHNLDADGVQGLLDLLRTPGADASRQADRWGLVVISKSGGTLETALAFRVFRDALEQFYGQGSEESRTFVLPITGESGKLRDLSDAAGYETTFPIPDGIGGRFSVLTPVGLLPAAIFGIDLVELLAGAADMTQRFREAPLGDNPVLDYTATCHTMEQQHGLGIRVLSTWGERLEALGFWYDQLLSESLGKSEQAGATPVTVVNSRDLHSRGQQHQEGRRDKFITNLTIAGRADGSLKIPRSDRNEDGLNQFAGRSYGEFLDAAIQGTTNAYESDERPSADMILPRLDAYSVGQLLQCFMLATVLEGRLIGVNPYGQPGVEGYKQAMNRILREGGATEGTSGA